MKSCESHCTACNRHFATDEAFDLHRQFEEGHEDDWDYRICVGREDDGRLKVADADGVCDLHGAEPLLHVEILRIDREVKAAAA